jgi:hypothetical protein
MRGLARQLKVINQAMETKSHSFFYRHRNLLSSQRGNITHGVIFLLIFGNLLRIDDKHACSGAPARTKLTKWDVDQSSTPVTSSSSRLDHSAMRIFALWLLLFWKKNMTICACCCRTFFSHHEVVLLHRPEPRMHCASIWLGDAACIRLQSNPFYSHWTATVHTRSSSFYLFLLFYPNKQKISYNYHRSYKDYKLNKFSQSITNIFELKHKYSLRDHFSIY